MSTLVQQNNSPHYPQSAMMNSGDAGARQRPENQPSKNLQQDELHSLYDILGSNCVTLATAAAQVLHGNNGAWRKQACGVFCFVKDYENRSYCFRLYDLKARHSIYEEVVPATLRLEKALDVFYTFDGMNCKIGINFADRDEAQTFSHRFHSKQEDRQCKKDRKKSNPPLPKVPPPSVQSPVMSTMMNGVKPPSANSLGQTLPTAAVTENTPKKSNTSRSSGFFTLGRKKNKTTRIDISSPVQATFVHVGHIGTTESFFHDEKQKQLFEDVLSGLQISPEDKIYVRDYISTDGGLEKLLAKPTVPVRDNNGPNQGSSSVTGSAPELPPRGFPTVGRSAGGRTPHQDVSVPPSSHYQSNNRSQPLQDLFTPPSSSNHHAAPSIPPRTGPRAPDNTNSPTQGPPAPPPVPPPQPPTGDFSRMQAPPAPPPPPPPPPPPMNWTEPTPRSGGGIPPPPPPPPLSPPPAPGPNVSFGTTKNTPSIPPPTENRDDLLVAIRNFKSTTKLKERQERPALPQVQAAPTESSPGAQDTMATNILKILAERRVKLIGTETADDSDSSQEDWSS